MEMFLMIACMSVFAMGVMAAAFGASTRHEYETPEIKTALEPLVSEPPARFFKDYVVSPDVTRPPVPIEALLAQIESHVRLEQAAAQSFMQMPTSALLHCKTISPLIQ